jgi:hypothetical protein
MFGRRKQPVRCDKYGIKRYNKKKEKIKAETGYV